MDNDSDNDDYVTKYKWILYFFLQRNVLVFKCIKEDSGGRTMYFLFVTRK
jgi:hypothetical protein